MPTGVRRFRIFDGPDAVAVLEEGPGPLVSTAPLPRGGRPPEHAFCGLTALDGAQEPRIRDALDAATDFDDLVRRLRGIGLHLQAEA